MTNTVLVGEALQDFRTDSSVAFLVPYRLKYMVMEMGRAAGESTAKFAMGARSEITGGQVSHMDDLDGTIRIYPRLPAKAKDPLTVEQWEGSLSIGTGCAFSVPSFFLVF
ncbi:hypothetical protein ABZ567_24460 [Streptomyces sp. NPDC016459]|uniref:hypothetical protein n=1 Tax=Streptomyces sp. NPDC016459 TaxID=3157190 RepID=UPI0033FC821E